MLFANNLSISPFITHKEPWRSVKLGVSQSWESSFTRFCLAGPSLQCGTEIKQSVATPTLLPGCYIVENSGTFHGSLLAYLSSWTVTYWTRKSCAMFTRILQLSLFWNNSIQLITSTYMLLVSLGGLGVTCSPRDPRFVGLNPAEVDGFFQDVKILSTSPPEGTLSWGSRVWDFRVVKETQAWTNRPLSKI